MEYEIFVLSKEKNHKNLNKRNKRIELAISKNTINT